MTPAVLPALPPVPRDHAWRQSHINTWLGCGRALGLELAGAPQRHELDGWASLLGDAAHAGIAHVLRQQAAGRALEQGEVSATVSGAFSAAVEKAQAEGAVTDPDGVARALERADEVAALVELLAADPRVQAIDWRAVEEPWQLELDGGRRFGGTRDAWGVARARIARFAVAGTELVDLHAGDVVLVDWKTGEEHDVGWNALSLNVQLALYRAGLSHPRVRLFIGRLRDLERRVRPRVDGVVIPSKLKTLNPRWLELTGQQAGPAAEASRKKATDPATKKPVPKWDERPNPEYLAACEAPKGPLFHEARIDWAVVSQTIADVVDAGRAGIFPASGAANGSCRRCSFRASCAHANPNPTN